MDSAKILLDDCLDFFEHNFFEDNSYLQGKALFYYSRVSFRGQELYAAKKYAQKAMRVFELLNDVKYQTTTLNLLGAIELGLSNFSKSMDFFSRAYHLKLSNNYSEEDCISELVNISIVYSRMGQMDKALESARKCYVLSQNINDVSRQFNILNTIGTYHINLKHYDSAFYYYRKCKQIALKTDRPDFAFLAEYNIANALSNNGYYRESNELMFALFNQQYNVAPSMDEIARSLVSKNYLRLNKLDSSILMATPIVNSAINSGSKQTIINTADILRQAYSEENPDSAYFYLNMLYTYKDSVYSIENQRKLSTLYAEFETLEKESEIQELKLTQYQNEVRTNLIMVVSAIIICFIIIVFTLFKVQQKRKNRRLEVRLEKSQKKLSSQTLSMIHRNNAFEEIELELMDVRSRCNGAADPGLRKIQNAISLNKALENDWNNFSNYFQELHSSFFNHLQNRTTDLSDYETRLCALIKLKLTNKEIATILNIEHKSVKMAKYRLKKKLNVGEKISLSEFIEALT